MVSSIPPKGTQHPTAPSTKHYDPVRELGSALQKADSSALTKLLARAEASPTTVHFSEAYDHLEGLLKNKASKSKKLPHEDVIRDFLQANGAARVENLTRQLKSSAGGPQAMLPLLLHAERLVDEGVAGGQTAAYRSVLNHYSYVKPQQRLESAPKPASESSKSKKSALSGLKNPFSSKKSGSKVAVLAHPSVDSSGAKKPQVLQNLESALKQKDPAKLTGLLQQLQEEVSLENPRSPAFAQAFDHLHSLLFQAAKAGRLDHAKIVADFVKDNAATRLNQLAGLIERRDGGWGSTAANVKYAELLLDNGWVRDSSEQQTFRNYLDSAKRNLPQPEDV